MCRAVCPVVEAELVETASPRAKVALCEAVKEGRLGISRALLDILERCTGCRACSLNCTSGTDPYGLAVLTRFEHMREEPRLPETTWSVSAFLRDVFVNPEKEIGEFRRKGRHVRARVAYFIGCAEASRLAEVPRNLLRVFENLGVETMVPEEQVCCGWPHILLGRLDSAKKLALRNRRAFQGFDIVLASCPHCLNTLTFDYPSLLGITTFRERTKDVLTYLVEEDHDKKLKMRRDSSRVLYARACRMGRGKDGETLHLSLLKKHMGKFLAEMNSNLCCGAPLQLLVPPLSRSMLENRMREIEGSGSSLVLS
ncbi:MAG: (Fe-S)-binding protein, partial [bacterium]